MDDQTDGLTSNEARHRLEKFGPNAMPDTALHPWRMALEKFWAPVPWMLETAVVLEVALGKYFEAGIIAGPQRLGCVLRCRGVRLARDARGESAGFTASLPRPRWSDSRSAIPQSILSEC
jgi:hypothetical protein